MTRMKSKVLVTMTMQEAFSCHTIRQKSGIVDSVGPWVTMYAFGWTRLWRGGHLFFQSTDDVQLSKSNWSIV